MTKPQRPTNLVVFNNLVDAEAAVAELRDRGLHEHEIGLAVRRSNETTRDTRPDIDITEERVAKKDIVLDSKGRISPAVGAGIGALAGIGVAAISLTVFGPVLAGGALAALLANSVAGGAFAGLFTTLIDWGMAEEEAHTLEDELAAGRTVVTVHASGREEEARAILNRHGGVDPRVPSTSARK